jgi:SPP1 family predicted phage head-tail adaptor
MPIGAQLAIGARIHKVRIETPGPVVSDGEGGFTQAWATVGAPWASIAPATARDLERLVAGTVQSTATHVITIDYLRGVTTAGRVIFNDRIFSITGVVNPEERNAELILTCEEVVQ